MPSLADVRTYTARVVAPSKADRPYGSFRRLFDEEIAEAPPPRALAWRMSLRRMRERTRGAQLFGASVITAVAIVALSGRLAPAPERLTAPDVDNAIKQALASATPKPNVAIGAFDAIKESVVQVRTRLGNESAPQVRGAGVLLDSGGTILTSLHIVRGATEIAVVFSDGAVSEAIISDAQPEFDIAVLAARESGRKPAVLASPKGLHVGDEAIVVGSPLGLPNSLSVGVISGLGRTFQPGWRDRPFGGLIQFQTAVYPGFSGGPLVNRRGEVVGIVTVLASESGLSGVGFAVPIDSASSAAGSNPF